MKDLAEELKLIRNSPPKDHLKLEELELIAHKVSSPDYGLLPAPPSQISRLKPECYTTFIFNNINIASLHEETLFYIFYSFIGTNLQIQAYNELINKGYQFSRHLESFVIIAGNKTADNKKRNILIFDPWDWKTASREIILDDKFVNSLETHITEN